MLPGAVLKKEEAATQTLEVSAFDGSRVPDETFILNYTQPGTIVHDGTDAGSTKSARGFIRYTAPARPDALPGVIDRARKAEEWATTRGGPSTAGESRAGAFASKP